MNAEPQKEHQWLQRLAGEWKYETDTTSEPGGEGVKVIGTESVRSLGGIWMLCEGRGGIPGGDEGTTIMTLGYDSEKKRFVGSFVGSMMTSLWIYDGELDEAGRVLTLDSEGPSFADDGTMAKYKDRIEIESDDRRVMTSSFRDKEGKWVEFMTSNYSRTK